MKEGTYMKLEVLQYHFSVCKVTDETLVSTNREFCFLAHTDEEISLVCPTSDVPLETTVREDGWRAFRIQGTLDFSLIGILAKISTILADHHIGIFVISTYNTDYILVKSKNFDHALERLRQAGYDVRN